MSHICLAQKARGTSGRQVNRRCISLRADSSSKGSSDDFRALCSVAVPTIWLLFQLLKACSVKLESSVFSVSCLFVFGSCQGITIECISSFNTKLQRIYPIQVLRGAACCCKILQRLLPLLLVMQFCFEEVLGKINFFLISFCCLTEYNVVFWAGRLEVQNTYEGCLLFLFLLFCIEPDLWDYTDAWPGIWGRLSTGSAGPEDQTAPQPPSGTRFRGHWDQVQPTCTQTTRQCTEVRGELDIKYIVAQDTIYCTHIHVWTVCGIVYWQYLNRSTKTTISSANAVQVLREVKGTGV